MQNPLMCVMCVGAGWWAAQRRIYCQSLTHSQLRSPEPCLFVTLQDEPGLQFPCCRAEPYLNVLCVTDGIPLLHCSVILKSQYHLQRAKCDRDSSGVGFHYFGIPIPTPKGFGSCLL